MKEIFKYSNSFLNTGQFLREQKYLYPYIRSLKCARQTQEKKLFKIIKENTDTEYGKRYGFKHIRTIQDYQKNVPIVNYEDISHYIQLIENGKKNVLTKECPIFYAITSGTSGTEKKIPFTKQFWKDYLKSNEIYFCKLGKNYPSLFQGSIFPIVGKVVDRYTKNGVPMGSISGYMIANAPWVERQFSAIPLDILNLDFVSKHFLLSRVGIVQNVRTIMTGNPAAIVAFVQRTNRIKETLLKDLRDHSVIEKLDLPMNIKKKLKKYLQQDGNLAEKLEKKIEKNNNFLSPQDYWPNLSLICCNTGGFAQLHLEKLKKYFPHATIRDTGILASEGRINIPFNDNTSNGYPAISSFFFEFLSMDERKEQNPLLIDKLESGKLYELILTAANGFYRYKLGDIIRAHDSKYCHTIEYAGRIDNAISIAGERVTEQEVLAAVSSAMEQVGIELSDFIVNVSVQGIPRYDFVVDFTKSVKNEIEKAFIKRIDIELCKANLCYYKCRYDHEELEPPRLLVTKKGEGYKFHNLVSSGDPFDGQKKNPSLCIDKNIKDMVDIAHCISL